MKVQLSSIQNGPIEQFKDTEIVVDINFHKAGVGTFLFDGCKFIFESTGSLKFQTCLIRNCIFQGFENYHTSATNAGFIEIISCKIFQNNQLKGQFRDIKITESIVTNYKDQSIVTNYSINTTEISDFLIKGECETIVLHEVKFQSLENKGSTWDKTIIKKAICTETIFDNVKINPFYFATKCKDKSSLDLSRATLIDNWSRLRKKYSGLSLFIVFLLTFLFFLPLLTHSFFLLLLSKIEGPLHLVKNMPLWKALLFGGKNGFNAVIYCLLTIVLLFYNVGRLYMTISISKLREEEIFLKDSNFNLVSIHPEKYKTQLELDKVLSVMFWLSVGYSVLKLLDTLMIAVPAFQ